MSFALMGFFCAMRQFLCVLFCLMSLTTAHAQSHGLEKITGKIFFRETSDHEYELRPFHSKNNQENPRLVAIALDITLGLLGMHRLYLGTDLKIPVAYTLTLGGGGVLWIVDLGLLIFSKDISKFYDNPRMFMWTAPDPK